MWAASAAWVACCDEAQARNRGCWNCPHLQAAVIPDTSSHAGAGLRNGSGVPARAAGSSDTCCHAGAGLCDGTGVPARAAGGADAHQLPSTAYGGMQTWVQWFGGKSRSGVLHQPHHCVSAPLSTCLAVGCGSPTLLPLSLPPRYLPEPFMVRRLGMHKAQVKS